MHSSTRGSLANIPPQIGSHAPALRLSDIRLASYPCNACSIPSAGKLVNRFRPPVRNILENRATTGPIRMNRVLCSPSPFLRSKALHLQNTREQLVLCYVWLLDTSLGTIYIRIRLRHREGSTLTQQTVVKAMAN